MKTDVLARLETQIEAIMLTPVDSLRLEHEKRITKECNYINRLLAIRLRSRHELETALVRRELDSATIKEILNRAENSGLIDDRAFAEAWVEQRHRIKGLAPASLRAELKEKGVAQDIIESVIGAYISAHQERSKAKSLVSRRILRERSSHPNMSWNERQKMVRRLHDYLQRKGYSSSLSLSVIYECLD